MPASLLYEMEHSSNGSPTATTLEDQRALQLALELSMLGLSSDSDPSGNLSQNNFPGDPDARAKKSQNTTECVPVPTSEHVAEIVGRQGKNEAIKQRNLFVFSLLPRLSPRFISQVLILGNSSILLLAGNDGSLIFIEVKRELLLRAPFLGCVVFVLFAAFVAM